MAIMSKIPNPINPIVPQIQLSSFLSTIKNTTATRKRVATSFQILN